MGKLLQFPQITWEIVMQTTPYQPGARACMLLSHREVRHSLSMSGYIIEQENRTDGKMPPHQQI